MVFASAEAINGWTWQTAESTDRPKMAKETLVPTSPPSLVITYQSRPSLSSGGSDLAPAGFGLYSASFLSAGGGRKPINNAKTHST